MAVAMGLTWLVFMCRQQPLPQSCRAQEQHMQRAPRITALLTCPRNKLSAP